MFHTIFNHPKGKKYIAYLISLFLKIDNDTLLKHMKIISNDVLKIKLLMFPKDVTLFVK